MHSRQASYCGDLASFDDCHVTVINLRTSQKKNGTNFGFFVFVWRKTSNSCLDMRALRPSWLLCLAAASPRQYRKSTHLSLYAHSASMCLCSKLVATLILALQRGGGRQHARVDTNGYIQYIQTEVHVETMWIETTCMRLHKRVHTIHIMCCELNRYAMSNRVFFHQYMVARKRRWPLASPSTLCW